MDSYPGTISNPDTDIISILKPPESTEWQALEAAQQSSCPLRSDISSQRILYLLLAVSIVKK
jgi:hypothetical protein